MRAGRVVWRGGPGGGGGVKRGEGRAATRWTTAAVAPMLTPFLLLTKGGDVDGPQAARPEPQEPLPVLHQGRLPSPRVRRLQRRGDPKEALQQPGQDDEPQANRQLRRVPAGGQ